MDTNSNFTTEAQSTPRVSFDFGDARQAIDFLEELLGSRSWHQHEPRCGYQREYQRLDALLGRLRKEFEAQLPSVEDVQRIYREILQNETGESRPNV